MFPRNICCPTVTLQKERKETWVESKFSRIIEKIHELKHRQAVDQTQVIHPKHKEKHQGREKNKT